MVNSPSTDVTAREGEAEGDQAGPEAGAQGQQESPASVATWTGILFVHGMGSQRRYGDVSALVEALDRRSRENGDGTFAGIDVKMEPARRPDAPPVAYLEAHWRPAPGDTRTYPRVRFYEAYWAPVTAAGVPARQVVRWLFAQVPKPIGGLLAPWRGKARLRRSILQGLTGGVTPQQRTLLFRAYDDYEGPAARRSYPEGDFDGFVEHLRSGPETARLTDGERAELVAIARRWHRRCVASELKNLLTLTTLAAALLAVVGLVVLTAVGVLLLRDGGASEIDGPAGLGRYIKDHQDTFAMLASTALLIPGVTGFLQYYLGDVVFWTTYEETQTRYEKRRQVLAEVRAYLRHLTQHPGCERIVVVAHSLGTAVALDAILGEARDNRALQGAAHRDQLLNLRRITHFVTYGSPIDKVQYFFERDAEQHRYHRIVEDLRGDIGTEPFGNNNGKAWVHWINFWDRADFISGVLESPANRRHPSLRVDNVEVASGPVVNPGQAHTRYLDRPAVLDTLLDVIFRRTDGHRGPAGLTGHTYGPGTPHRTDWQVVLGMVLVWALVAFLVYCIVDVRVGLAATVTTALAALGLLVTLLGKARSLRANLAVALESARALLPF